MGNYLEPICCCLFKKLQDDADGTDITINCACFKSQNVISEDESDTNGQKKKRKRVRFSKKVEKRVL